MNRAGVEMILVMLKEGKIQVPDALDLIEALVGKDNGAEEVKEVKETKEPIGKKLERGFNTAKENVKKGVQVAGEKINDFAKKVDNAGVKCAEVIKEEFKKDNADDEEVTKE